MGREIAPGRRTMGGTNIYISFKIQELIPILLSMIYCGPSLFYYEMHQVICVDTFGGSNQFLSYYLDFFPII